MSAHGKILIKDVIKEVISDLCLVCVPSEKRQDPDWIKGMEEKRAWALDMLQRWGSFAKVSYVDNEPAGMIQYHPVPEENIVWIDCIYIHEKRYWRKGIGSQLLASLIEDMERPSKWFENRVPSALVVRTFPGESEGQLSAREFFTKKGFQTVGDDTDFLYYPIEKNFVYQSHIKTPIEYQPQDEDKGKVLIFCGPNNCAAAYPFLLKRMERYIREIDEKIPIVYIDIVREPEMAKRRNANYGDCVVNGKVIKTFVLDKTNFQREIQKALANWE